MLIVARSRDLHVNDMHQFRSVGQQFVKGDEFIDTELSAKLRPLQFGLLERRGAG